MNLAILSKLSNRTLIMCTTVPFKANKYEHIVSSPKAHSCTSYFHE